MTEHRIDLTQLRRVRDGSGHSIFGASGYAHFLLCHGALIPNLLVHDPGNEDAAYGTIAHGVTERWLKTSVRPEYLLGTFESRDGFQVEIDEEMLVHAAECVLRCELLPGLHLIEQRVDYSDLTPIPDQGGTLDHAALMDGWAIIDDHKFGKHNMIFAERNFQLMLYAYGIWKRYNWLYHFEWFTLRINQPRLGHFDEWTCTTAELLSFAAWAKQQMYAAWKIDAPRTPGEVQCMYCKIASSCTANAMYQVNLIEGKGDAEITVEAMHTFKDRVTDPDGLEVFELYALEAGNLHTAEIARLHEQSKTALRFWNRLAAELFRRAKEGEDLSTVGLKLVEGRSRRYFPNAAWAEEMLSKNGVDHDKIYEQSIVSPAKATKLLRAAGVRAKDIPALLEGLTDRPPGKPTLARLADRRPEIVDIANLAFGDASETTETTEEED